MSQMESYLGSLFSLEGTTALLIGVVNDIGYILNSASDAYLSGATIPPGGVIAADRVDFVPSKNLKI